MKIKLTNTLNLRTLSVEMIDSVQEGGKVVATNINLKPREEIELELPDNTDPKDCFTGETQCLLRRGKLRWERPPTPHAVEKVRQITGAYSEYNLIAIGNIDTPITGVCQHPDTKWVMVGDWDRPLRIPTGSLRNRERAGIHEASNFLTNERLVHATGIVTSTTAKKRIKRYAKHNNRFLNKENPITKLGIGSYQIQLCLGKFAPYLINANYMHFGGESPDTSSHRITITHVGHNQTDEGRTAHKMDGRCFTLTHEIESSPGTWESAELPANGAITFIVH